MDGRAAFASNAVELLACCQTTPTTLGASRLDDELEASKSFASPQLRVELPVGEQNSFCRVNLELLRSDIGPDVWSGRASQKVFVDIVGCGSCINVSSLTLERVMSAFDSRELRALRILVKRNKLDIAAKKYISDAASNNSSYWLDSGVQHQSQQCLFCFLYRTGDRGEIVVSLSLAVRAAGPNEQSRNASARAHMVTSRSWSKLRNSGPSSRH